MTELDFQVITTDIRYITSEVLILLLQFNTIYRFYIFHIVIAFHKKSMNRHMISHALTVFFCKSI